MPWSKGAGLYLTFLGCIWELEPERWDLGAIVWDNDEAVPRYLLLFLRSVHILYNKDT